MKGKALTITEILCALAVVAVLTVVLVPVLAKAKGGQNVSQAKENLKGFWRGLMLYQEQYDHALEYGPTSHMGLPNYGRQWEDFVGQYTGDFSLSWEGKRDFLPCGMPEYLDLHFPGIWYFPGAKDEWIREVMSRRENTVVIVDITCNPKETLMMNPTTSKRVIGITLEGAIRDRTRTGLMFYDQRFYQ